MLPPVSLPPRDLSRKRKCLKVTRGVSSVSIQGRLDSAHGWWWGGGVQNLQRSVLNLERLQDVSSCLGRSTAASGSLYFRQLLKHILVHVEEDVSAAIAVSLNGSFLCA